MTTLISNPAGGRKSSTKDRKTLHPNKSERTSNVVVSTNANPNESAAANSNQVTEEFKANNKTDKFQPTAEQMRIASLMSDKKDDDLKPKIEKICELTGATRDDAAVALYDCDNDMPKAIEMILDGESFDSEWQSTGRKKKTKALGNQINEVITNGNKSTEKPVRSNNKNNANVGGAQAKGPRGGGAMAIGKNNRKKDYRANTETQKNADGEESGDSFPTNNADLMHKKIGKRGSAPRGRGAARGRGIARGSRTFMNRGMQNSNVTNSSNDGFPNSIETWTNNTVEAPKTANNDLNTMTVGNWSDVAANEEWSEDDWTAPMETKVFTPSTKVIPEKDELKEQINKTEEPSQPTMSAIISNNIKRPSQPTSAGQALLQQIQLQQQQQQAQQQQSNVSQNSSLNQYNMSQYSKQATESIKSLVGMTPMIPNEHPLENLSKTTQQQPPSNQNRLKVQNISSKIPETAVEMPSNDPISNLSLHFSGLEFGFQVNTAKKTDNKTLPLQTNATANETVFPAPNSNGNANKNILQSQVLPHQLNDSLLNNDHRNDKSQNPSSYNPNKPLERKNDFNSMNYKPSYPPLSEAVYPGYNQPTPSSSINAANVGYYSTNQTNQVPYGGQSTTNPVNLMANNIYNSNMAYNQANAPKGIRDMDNGNSIQTPQVSSSAANKAPYDTSSNVGTSLSQMSSSTSTTNAIKNTLSSTGKGIHNMPPGVTNSLQPTQVLSPYLMSNPTLSIPYYPFDLSFPATAHTRDPNYTSYATAEVKYNRNSESDMLPVSSQTASAAQTATQAHSAYYNYPGNYFLSYNFPHNFYGNPQPAMYPVAQAQNQASTNSAFVKPNTAANYGSHSYNSGYESMGTAVPQTQDYANKPYQHAKPIAGTAAGDITANPQNMYSKAHPQMNKNYDKQGFQAQAPPMNMANPAQPAANMSSAYNNTYMLPHHQQPIHHSFTNPEPTQQTAAGGNQRNIMHKNISSNTGASYGKFNWN